MNARLTTHVGRLLASFLIFLVLSEVWDVLIDGVDMGVYRQELLAAAIVAVLVVFWRARQDARKSKMRAQ